MKKVLVLVGLLCVASVAMAQYSAPPPNPYLSNPNEETTLRVTCFHGSNSLPDRIYCVMGLTNFRSIGQTLASLSWAMENILIYAENEANATLIGEEDVVEAKRMAQELKDLSLQTPDGSSVNALAYVTQFAPQLAQDEEVQKEFLSQMHEIYGRHFKTNLTAKSEHILGLANRVDQLAAQ